MARPTGKSRTNEFAQARRVMAKHLTADDGLYLGYVANVAMLLHDRWGIRRKDRRDRAAAEVLDLVFGLMKAPQRD